jgi:calumenin
MDRNNDGFIDIEEFVLDIYPKYKDGRTEPEWVKNERENFKNHHDTNKDGKLDRNELSVWILPEDYDVIETSIYPFLL